MFCSGQKYSWGLQLMISWDFKPLNKPQTERRKSVGWNLTEIKFQQSNFVENIEHFVQANLNLQYWAEILDMIFFNSHVEL